MNWTNDMQEHLKFLNLTLSLYFLQYWLNKRFMCYRQWMWNIHLKRYNFTHPNRNQYRKNKFSSNGTFYIIGLSSFPQYNNSSGLSLPKSSTNPVYSTLFSDNCIYPLNKNNRCYTTVVSFHTRHSRWCQSYPLTLW